MACHLRYIRHVSCAISSLACFHAYCTRLPLIPANSLADMTGVGSWAISYNKAVALVNNMTLEERVSLTTGASSYSNGCSGYISPVSSVGFPGMCLSDAGNGLRNTDFVSSWPSGIHVGASWNRDLAASRARGMAAEFKKKGVNVLLGPVVSPVGRTVRTGRYWEGTFCPAVHQAQSAFSIGLLTHE